MCPPIYVCEYPQFFADTDRIRIWNFCTIMRIRMRSVSRSVKMRRAFATHYSASDHSKVYDLEGI